jgi:hypothetical protein
LNLCKSLRSRQGKALFRPIVRFLATAITALNSMSLMDTNYTIGSLFASGDGSHGR